MDEESYRQLEELKAELKESIDYEGLCEKLADENVRLRQALEFIADSDRFNLKIVQDHAREVLNERK